MRNKKMFLILILFFALLATFSPGSLFGVLIILSIIFIIQFIADEKEKIFLRNIFISGITLRIILLLSVQFILIFKKHWMYLGIEGIPALFGDAGMNTIVPWWYAQYVMGKPLSDYGFGAVFTGSFVDYGRTGYLYLVALFYYLFGYSPISVTVINCILSVLTGIIYYFIAKDVAGIRPARITAILIIFFPSLVIWSIANLKEPLFIFLTAIILWLFMRFLRTNKLRYLILATPAIFLQYTLRQWIVSPTFFAIFFCYSAISKKRRKILYVCFIAIVIFLVFSPFVRNKFLSVKTGLIDYHRGVAGSGGFIYHIYEDWVYNPGTASKEVTNFNFILGMLKGWFHSLCEPLSWHIFSKSTLIVLPQMLIWYFLLPFCFLGILFLLKSNWDKSLILILLFLQLGSILSLTGGNIGTAFRMRDMLTPMALLFSSVGLVRIFGFKDIFTTRNQ